MSVTFHPVVFIGREAERTNLDCPCIPVLRLSANCHPRVPKHWSEVAEKLLMTGGTKPQLNFWNSAENAEQKMLPFWQTDHKKNKKQKTQARRGDRLELPREHTTHTPASRRRRWDPGRRGKIPTRKGTRNLVSHSDSPELFSLSGKPRRGCYIHPGMCLRVCLETNNKKGTEPIYTRLMNLKKITGEGAPCFTPQCPPARTAVKRDGQENANGHRCPRKGSPPLNLSPCRFPEASPLRHSKGFFQGPAISNPVPTPVFLAASKSPQ